MKSPVDYLHGSTLLALILVVALLPAPAAADASTQPAWQAASSPGLGGPVRPPQSVPSRTPAALPQGWYDGSIQYSTITNCVSIIQDTPYTEYGAGTYVGYFAHPDAGQPAVNDVYYVHVVVEAIGNACSGQQGYIDIGLPSNTTLAISGSNPVYCFANGVALTPASDCPQTLPGSSYNTGMYQIPPPAPYITWPMPIGQPWEFQIPVRSTTTLTSSNFQAKVLVLDGNSSPWLNPTAPVYVWAGSSTPTVSKFKSTGSKDGWVLESGENTNAGGSMDSAAITVILGDNAAKKQYRTILSFNTGAILPDNAVITSVKLKLRGISVSPAASDPISLLQGIFVDVRKGFFSSSSGLQLADFGAPGNKTAGPFSPSLSGGSYNIRLPSKMFAYINKGGTGGGMTQFRLRFKLDDNNNSIANLLSLASGNHPTTSYRPLLIITYTP